MAMTECVWSAAMVLVNPRFSKSLRDWLNKTKEAFGSNPEPPSGISLKNLILKGFQLFLNMCYKAWGQPMIRTAPAIT